MIFPFLFNLRNVCLAFRQPSAGVIAFVSPSLCVNIPPSVPQSQEEPASGFPVRYDVTAWWSRGYKRQVFQSLKHQSTVSSGRKYILVLLLLTTADCCGFLSVSSFISFKMVRVVTVVVVLCF